MARPKYKRIMLKLSGEALAGDNKIGIDRATIDNICNNIKKLYEMGIEIAIVVGAGNLWRGRYGEGMDRTTADYMGMLATAINSLAIQNMLETKGVPAVVQSAIEMRQIAEPYVRRKAVGHLDKGRVVIFACGTGHPYFSTDTAAALRAAETSCEVILLAKSVDGVYDSDPVDNPNAKKFDEITYSEVLARGLKVMDSTATSLCMDNNIPIIVFGLDKPENMIKVVMGEGVGTSVV